ncbi:MAG: subclass B3 metallo-beta-lactamase [Sphingomonas sp.]
MLKKTIAWMGMAAALAGSAVASQSGDDPLLRPIEPDYAARWLAPQKPMRIFGNTYLVGFGGLNVGLIRTDAGLILIDGAVPQAVPAIEANIRALGFKLSDVKMILSTEPHFDHAGGLAALSRDTGAPVIAGAAAGPALRGAADAEDPQHAMLIRFPAVRNLKLARPGEKFRLGSTVITAVATPGHTRGSTSWTWRSCEGRRCVAMVFASSLNPVSADGYLFSDPAHVAVLANYRRSFATMRALPCGAMISAHPDQSGGDAKMRRFIARPVPNPFLDPGACRAYADKYAALLAARLAKERSDTNR